jgi:hypothetical protein
MTGVPLEWACMSPVEIVCAPPAAPIVLEVPVASTVA